MMSIYPAHPRRQSMEGSTVSVPGTRLSTPPEAANQAYPYTLADLPYAYDALEPHVDQKTLQVHHRGLREKAQ